MSQVRLEFEPRRSDERGEATIKERFEAFRLAHPEVEEELVRLCRRALSRGRTRFGMKALWEVMRWNFWMKYDPDEEPFKLNNNYTAHYARLLMRNYPDLKGIFELRERRKKAS